MKTFKSIALFVSFLATFLYIYIVKNKAPAGQGEGKQINIITMESNNIQGKGSLKRKVIQILFLRGYSKEFNSIHFEMYRDQTKGAFNQALEIAKLFIKNSCTDGDFADYVF